MDKILNLIEVKKLIALMFAIVFATLALRGIVSAEQFIVVFSTVIGYYFGQSSVRNAISESKTVTPTAKVAIIPTPNIDKTL